MKIEPSFHVIDIVVSVCCSRISKQKHKLYAIRSGNDDAERHFNSCNVAPFDELLHANAGAGPMG